MMPRFVGLGRWALGMLRLSERLGELIFVVVNDCFDVAALALTATQAVVHLSLSSSIVTK
jgi:hypothetical protein